MDRTIFQFSPICPKQYNFNKNSSAFYAKLDKVLKFLKYFEIFQYLKMYLEKQRAKYTQSNPKK